MKCLTPVQLKTQDGYLQLVQCNHCLNCSIRRQLGWTIRICLEGSLSGLSTFTTLTYDEAHRRGHLHYPDVQGYMKRLRKTFPNTVRFFCVGQYGGSSGREHWHIILFGVTPQAMAEKLKTPLSAIPGRGLQGLAPLGTALWPHGSTHIAELNTQRARYAARYSLRTGPRGDENIVQMSRKPGIGVDAIRQIGAYCATVAPQWERVPGWWRMGKSLYSLDHTSREALGAAFKQKGGVILREGLSPLEGDLEARQYVLSGELWRGDLVNRVKVQRIERRELERGYLS